MTKIDTIATKFAAIVCTIALSATMVLGAVAPAQADAVAPHQIARVIA